VGQGLVQLTSALVCLVAAPRV